MTAALRKTIFVGCKTLGLDEEARRDLQARVTGKPSLSVMTNADLEAVVTELKRLGFKPTGKKRARAPRADLRLVHVLWRELGKAGALDNPTREGLNAFVRRRFGDHWQSIPADIDMLRDHDKIADVIDALKAWCRRKDVELDHG